MIFAKTWAYSASGLGKGMPFFTPGRHKTQALEENSCMLDFQGGTAPDSSTLFKSTMMKIVEITKVQVHYGVSIANRWYVTGT
ncbi:unnamed protein product [Leptosia nina]|uniref:Uncharacterized protein n=1 Tax=Leptosia nina TaxID=320188 RepID=A0AAV1J029_9NEOP